MVYIPKSLYKAQELQVVGNFGVVTEGTTQHIPRFCKYKYLHVKIASLVIVNLSCVAVVKPHP